MTGMASNYDMNMLIYGEIAAGLASVAAIGAVASSASITTASLLPFVLTTVLYGIMMFASSYVEEEQHFWYWTTSAWLFALAIRS